MPRAPKNIFLIRTALIFFKNQTETSLRDETETRISESILRLGTGALLVSMTRPRLELSESESQCQADLEIILSLLGI